MSFRAKVGFWVGAALVAILLLYIFRGILLPFVAGMAIAYLLDPLADRLERIGASRALASTIILLAFVLVLVLALMVLVPVLGNQLAGFIERVPSYIEGLRDLISGFGGSRVAEFLNLSDADLEESMGDLVNQSAGWATEIAQSLWSGGQAVISFISLFVVTPVVAFYLLLDWDKMVRKVDGWLPRDHVETVRELAREMDRGVSGFIRGQTLVCIIQGVFYAVLLTIVGLNFGLLIGLFAGLIGFIPYVGAILGGVLAIGVALVQFWPDFIMIGIVAGIFALGQFLEGNILQPKLVGSSVGLHPVWLMFALFAFGSLLGFVGLLIAVPAAAAVAVLVRFGLKSYKESRLYSGQARSEVAIAPAPPPLPEHDARPDTAQDPRNVPR